MFTTGIEDLHRTRILSAMTARQGHTTDPVFASRLGVPPQTLQAARSGTQSLGIPLLASLVRAYPELEQAATTYLWALITERQEPLTSPKPSRCHPKD